MFPTSYTFSGTRSEIRRSRRSFWHQKEGSSSKIDEVGFSLFFLLLLNFFNKYEVAGSRRKSPYLSRSILSMFPTSKQFSETCSELRRSRRNFWHQKKVSGLKIEEIGIGIWIFVTLVLLIFNKYESRQPLHVDFKYVPDLRIFSEDRSELRTLR